jgi:hypothetical protein
MTTGDPRNLRLPDREELLAPAPKRHRRAFAAVFFVAVASLVLVGGPAWAHGGQSATEGYVMVQQAISYLINEPGPTGTSEALVRVDNALAAKDQDGVDVPTVVTAQADLKAGNPDAARPLLQESIKTAVAALKPATGEETGTGTVVPPFQGTVSLSGMNLLLLVLSVVAALVGAGLVYLLRPKENLRALTGDILAARMRLANESHAPSSGREDDVR